MRRNSSPTLQDIAREVGVSSMTVSAVLHGNRTTTRVSDTTRARILDVAARLQYRPNAVARGLSRRRMDTIGVVAVIDSGELNLYFLEVLNGILQEAARHGQNATIFSIADWEKDESRILQFCDGRVDGIVFIGSQFSQDFAATLQRHIPYVTIHGNGAYPNTYDLDVDNEGGAYTAVRYLIEQGHRRIFHFAGNLVLLGARQRFDGYRRALEEAGLPFDDSMMIPCGFSQNAGHAAMMKVLADRERKDLPTAVFCANDAIACGVMEALARQGLRVPEEVSLVGFDDTMAARMTNPNLTTVRQPFRRMGQRSVDLLLTLLKVEEDPDDSSQAPVTPVVEIFDVELIIRGSVCPPAGDA